MGWKQTSLENILLFSKAERGSGLGTGLAKVGWEENEMLPIALDILGKQEPCGTVGLRTPLEEIMLLSSRESSVTLSGIACLP